MADGSCSTAKQLLVVPCDPGNCHIYFGVQRRALPTAVALARALSRTLVLPPLEWYDGQAQVFTNAFLATEAGEPILRANHAVQREAGASWIELLRPDALARRFPWLRSEGLEGDAVALGAHGTRNEGWFDPWALVCNLKAKAGDFFSQFSS